MTGVRMWAGTRDFFFILQNVQTGSGAYPGSYQHSFLGYKATRMWSSPLIYIFLLKLRMSGSTPLLLPIFLCGMHRDTSITDLLNTSLQCCFKNNLCYRKHTAILLKRPVDQRYLRKYSPFLLCIIMNPYT